MKRAGNSRLAVTAAAAWILNKGREEFDWVSKKQSDKIWALEVNIFTSALLFIEQHVTIANANPLDFVPDLHFDGKDNVVFSASPGCYYKQTKYHSMYVLVAFGGLAAIPTC